MTFNQNWEKKLYQDMIPVNMINLCKKTERRVLERVLKYKVLSKILQFLLWETRRCSVNKVLLKISQNSRRNTCARVCFLIMLQALACNSIKKETLAKIFSCEFCEIFKNTFFYRTPSVALLKHVLPTYSVPLKQNGKADKIKRNFFPRIHIFSRSLSFFLSIGNWFMQSIVKLGIVPGELVTKIITWMKMPWPSMQFWLAPLIFLLFQSSK